MGVGWRCASTLRAPRAAAPSPPLRLSRHPRPTQVHLLCGGINVKSLNGLAPRVTYRNIVIAIVVLAHHAIYLDDYVCVKFPYRLSTELKTLTVTISQHKYVYVP